MPWHNSISLRRVTKRYQLRRGRRWRLGGSDAADLEEYAPAQEADEVETVVASEDVESPKTPSRVAALVDVSLDVPPGVGVALFGGVGAGKTTLLRLVLGVLSPDSGSVCVATPIASPSVGIGESPELGLAKNAYLNARFLGASRADAEEASWRAVEFAGMSQNRATPYRSLTLLEKKRLAIAVMISVRPRTIVVDGDLLVGDQTFQEKTMKAYAELQADGTSLILHDDRVGQLRRLCKRAIVLSEGRVSFDGPFDEGVAARPPGR